MNYSEKTLSNQIVTFTIQNTAHRIYVTRAGLGKTIHIVKICQMNCFVKDI